MKTSYIAPQTTVVWMDVVMPIAGSEINAKNGDAGMGIGYGGIDTDGSKNPSARRNNIWNDEDDANE